MSTNLYGILSILLRLYDVGLTGYSGPHASMIICASLRTSKSHAVWWVNAKNWIVDVKTIVCLESDVPSFPVRPVSCDDRIARYGESLVKATSFKNHPLDSFSRSWRWHPAAHEVLQESSHQRRFRC